MLYYTLWKFFFVKDWIFLLVCSPQLWVWSGPMKIHCYNHEDTNKLLYVYYLNFAVMRNIENHIYAELWWNFKSPIPSAHINSHSPPSTFWQISLSVRAEDKAVCVCSVVVGTHKWFFAALAGKRIERDDDLAAWRARRKLKRERERKKFNCAMLSKAF